MQVDMATIMQAISTVGFPIACCVFLFWFEYKQNEREHQNFDKLAEAITSQTQAITELSNTVRELATRVENVESEVEHLGSAQHTT